MNKADHKEAFFREPCLLVLGDLFHAQSGSTEYQNRILPQAASAIAVFGQHNSYSLTFDTVAKRVENMGMQCAIYSSNHIDLHRKRMNAKTHITTYYNRLNYQVN